MKSIKRRFCRIILEVGGARLSLPASGQTRGDEEVPSTRQYKEREFPGLRPEPGNRNDIASGAG